MGKVVVLGTGGTIASRVDHARGEVTSAASGEELVATMTARGFALPPGVALETEQVCNLGSYLIDLELAFALARRAGAHLERPEVLGVVVTHGTDTLEESAYLADLVVGSDKPLVFTGAQRHADEPDSDGPRNLIDSIRVAASPDAHGLGSVILFEQELHAARDATKLHASRAATFQSGEHGKLGEVDRGRVIVQRRPLVRRHFPVERIEPRIDLIKLVMGADARFIEHALDTGARGLVLEAFGRGNANHAVIAALETARRRGVPVLVTTRCAQGRVEPIYGDGGGKDVAAAGGLFAGDLSAIKARILLAVLLGRPACADLPAAVAGIAG